MNGADATAGMGRRPIVDEERPLHHRFEAGGSSRLFPPRRKLWVALALAALGTAPAAQARQKTDLVFLTNGDRITGEIKQLRRGILNLKTDDISTINIEWNHVDSLVSGYQFRVEDKAGNKFFGVIALTRAGRLRVTRMGKAAADVQSLDVVAITPLEESFWQQLDGSLSVGASYTKSSSVGQLTLDANVKRRTEFRLLELDMTSILTTQADEETKRQGDFAFRYRQLFSGRAFWTATAEAQRNDELGLDLRALFAPGIGASLVQTNHSEFLATTGLSVNREWRADATEDNYNLEAYASAELGGFLYDYPKTDVSLDAYVYPNLTTWGRVRMEIDASASREVVKDFIVSLTFYDSFDNEPGASAEKNDYGFVMSVGWTF
jgi:uncharacterized protein DUF481